MCSIQRSHRLSAAAAKSSSSASRSSSCPRITANSICTCTVRCVDGVHHLALVKGDDLAEESRRSCASTANASPAMSSARCAAIAATSSTPRSSRSSARATACSSTCASRGTRHRPAGQDPRLQAPGARPRYRGGQSSQARLPRGAARLRPRRANPRPISACAKCAS